MFLVPLERTQRCQGLVNGDLLMIYLVMGKTQGEQARALASDPLLPS